MHFDRISSITIEYENLIDLSATGNPIAKDEIIQLLKEAIEHGKSVYITEGSTTYKLSLDGEKFKLNSIN